MASLQEYCRKIPTGTLEDIVFGDLQAQLPEVILIICDILLERQPDRLDVLKIKWNVMDDLEK